MIHGLVVSSCARLSTSLRACAQWFLRALGVDFRKFYTLFRALESFCTSYLLLLLWVSLQRPYRPFHGHHPRLKLPACCYCWSIAPLPVFWIKSWMNIYSHSCQHHRFFCVLGVLLGGLYRTTIVLFICPTIMLVAISKFDVCKEANAASVQGWPQDLENGVIPSTFEHLHNHTHLLDNKRSCA